MSIPNIEDLNKLYPVDLDEYVAAAGEDAAEYSFTLDGQEVSVDGSSS